MLNLIMSLIVLSGALNAMDPSSAQMNLTSPNNKRLLCPPVEKVNEAINEGKRKLEYEGQEFDIANIYGEVERLLTAASDNNFRFELYCNYKQRPRAPHREGDDGVLIATLDTKVYNPAACRVEGKISHKITHDYFERPNENPVAEIDCDNDPNNCPLICSVPSLLEQSKRYVRENVDILGGREKVQEILPQDLH